VIKAVAAVPVGEVAGQVVVAVVAALAEEVAVEWA
jgi:hypothetical protein